MRLFSAAVAVAERCVLGSCWRRRVTTGRDVATTVITQTNVQFGKVASMENIVNAEITFVQTYLL
jgi:hypothetical protein